MRFGFDSDPLTFQRLSEGSGSSLITNKHQHERKETWRTSEGDSLEDYGVDEEADLYDEDELPLAEVRRRRKLAAQPPDAEKKTS